MTKALIFDLDNTLISTDSLKMFRNNREWNKCYSNVHQTKLIFNPNHFNEYTQIGIVTNSPRPYAIKLLNYHEIHYDCLIAYHDTSYRKPYPEPFLKCLQNLNTDSANSISIGDHFNDTIAAKSAGIFSIGVTWGDGTFSQHQSSNADLIISNPDSLNTSLINLLNKGESL
ncbi:HAD-IIIA family hydrolase [Lysinibacillus louembei]|uniref:HAD-IIIA family hydrolase n=1 Tax=Lysinibacillus louembei TaxID=1470088 RepID=A0ABZ0RQA9_9BACI|nr:HAD-IIIA family hydrolase [Lysinibacillus louembei]WPK10290.1 HAD-IIIA family hydrolase [Lysinibacillus louembei]